METDLSQKLDERFVAYMLEIEKRYINYSKHQKIRIEQWSRKLCQVTTNLVWKKNRNLYSMLLLDQVISNYLQPPFKNVPPEGPLPVMSETTVKSQLSQGFKELRPIIEHEELSEKYEELNEIKAEMESKQTGVCRQLRSSSKGRGGKKGHTPESIKENIEEENKESPVGKQSNKESPVGKQWSGDKHEHEHIELKIREYGGGGKTETTERLDAKAMEMRYKSEITRLRSQIDVLNITLKHTRNELGEKTTLVTRQMSEINGLTKCTLALQEENRMLRAKIDVLGDDALQSRAQRLDKGIALSRGLGGIDDQDQTIFLQYLHKFQKESEKLSKETEDILEKTEGYGEEGLGDLGGQGEEGIVHNTKEQIEQFDKELAFIFEEREHNRSSPHFN